jgi:DNA modification methylase
VVLDPFAGVATTGVVALEEGRSFIGIELNPTYHATGRVRLAGVSPLLATEAPPVSAQGELFTGAEEQP